jgi:hypothetical protein
MKQLTYVALGTLRLAFFLTACGIVAACSSSGSPSGDSITATTCVPTDPSTVDACSTVLVAVTDADGDFVSYIVDVLSITLTRADGGSVETLPAHTRVDFAELSELSELLSAATLVPGDIVGGTIQLDYTNAEIFVESGGDVLAAEAVDDDGAALGIVDVQIRLDDRQHLVLTRARTALLRIDFDLAASHDVDISIVPARVTTRPFLIAEVDPFEEKELRVRGALIDVDLEQSRYEIRVRPWHRRLVDHGTMTVFTTETTEFEIGDAVHIGAAGLEALSMLERGTPTVAFGTLHVASRTFTAARVFAHDSVGGDRFAAIHGNVVARNGDTLTVKGALAVHRDRPARFRRTVLVEVGPRTHVSRVGDRLADLDQEDISVGQRIVAFGQFANADSAEVDPLAPDIALILDATEGRVRLRVTRLHGTVHAIVPGQLNMTLRAIDRLGIDLFNFAGTGPTSGEDADPTDYEIYTSTLSLDGLEVGKWARVHGFVTRFGMAPPDFTGRAVVDHRDIPAAAGIGWGVEGTAAPFASMGSPGLVLNMTNPDIGLRHHLLLGRTLIDLFDLPGPLTVAPDSTHGLYAVAEPGHVELFADFAAFADEIAIRLGAGSRAQAFAAYGSFDESSIELTTPRAAIHMTLAGP